MTWFDFLSNWLTFFCSWIYPKRKDFVDLQFILFIRPSLSLKYCVSECHSLTIVQLSLARERERPRLHHSLPGNQVMLRCRASGRRSRGTTRKRRKNLPGLQSLGKKKRLTKQWPKKGQTRSKKVRKSNICTKCSFAGVDHAHIHCTHKIFSNW